MNKIKFLIVSASMAQGGNERWIYEICRSIDKEAFDVSVLCDRKYLLTEKDQNFGNYYYHELKRIGVKLLEYLDTEPKPNPVSHLLYRGRRLARHLAGRSKTKISKEILSVLNESDVICLIDFYNYSTLKDVIHRCCGNKFFIVLHSHKAQFDYDPYAWFEKDISYRFTYFCPKQVAEIETSGLSLAANSFFFNPLVLDLSGYTNRFNPIRENTLTYSVFTRISRTKPIDVFISAFAKIRNQLAHQCFLNIYGEIQDKEYHLQLLELIRELNIDDAVRFMGHTTSIAESIKNDHVNIYWGLGINASCGYSSIEIGAMGIPCFFWNLDEDTDFRAIAEQTEGNMMVHNNIDDFVANNLHFLEETQSLDDLSIRQKKFFTDRHDISKKIKDFEKYLISIAHPTRSENG